MGFQEENADTIPSEIPCKPVVDLDGTASGHTPTEHHIRKKQIFYSQMTRLDQNNNLNYQPYTPASRSLPERETETTGKITVKLTLCKHKEINYRTTHFFSCFQSILFSYNIKN